MVVRKKRNHSGDDIRSRLMGLSVTSRSVSPLLYHPYYQLILAAGSVPRPLDVRRGDSPRVADRVGVYWHIFCLHFPLLCPTIHALWLIQKLDLDCGLLGIQWSYRVLYSWCYLPDIISNIFPSVCGQIVGDFINRRRPASCSWLRWTLPPEYLWLLINRLPTRLRHPLVHMAVYLGFPLGIS